MSLISLSEYAALHGRAAISVQQKARRGGFKTAKKIGRNWVIDAEEPYEDNRHGSIENVVRTRKCRLCGKEFNGGPRAWYCPECREQRRIERDREWKRNKRAGIPANRPIGSIDVCKACGKEYVVTSGKQKYCHGCAHEAVKEVDKQQALEYYDSNKDEINLARYEKRRIKNRICVVCGKEFESDGTVRNTCSEECRKKKMQKYHKEYDAKRQNKKSHTGN